MRTITYIDQCLDDGENACNSLSEHVNSCTLGDGNAIVVRGVIEDVVVAETNVANCGVSINTNLIPTKNHAQRNRDNARKKSRYPSAESN